MAITRPSSASRSIRSSSNQVPRVLPRSCMSTSINIMATGLSRNLPSMRRMKTGICGVTAETMLWIFVQISM